MQNFAPGPDTPSGGQSLAFAKIRPGAYARDDLQELECIS